ncbi:MAG TPA: Bax inhibitor-1/YccA family protein [Nitrospirae bacterium]|nr:bax inhibitor 1 like protein [bacterium BMS3Abin09]GBE41256.1 bax inhibitor 1 like protein [bacterium BMS3Bbin09]HDH33893.1 Bax inhibitor-1/YccA family protein [Nitrospirota bacterium]HDN94664.1 Bax inhibitor-1/YccA family protein [Nitrospirota bacterium]HDO66610.1 Bax inhibitor-1/YccA family protein [Nitrospirota bacterium]
MRTANPALNAKTFKNLPAVMDADQAMSIQGTVNKTFMMLVLLVITASWTWSMFYTTRNPATVFPWMIGGAIGGFAVAIVTVFKKHWSGITAPIYAILEGFFLGGISAVFESRYPGIVMQAVTLTFGTLFGLLFAYKSGLIKVTENFRLGVVAATGGIALVYIASFVLGFFGINMPFIHESGIMGIGFSLFVVVIAALNLVLDFDFIESGAEAGAPKFMEWYAAFGLMVTLIWLYLEILRLLSKLRSRN